MQTIKKIFWTGGFDSTFRIIQLSRTECVVQPVYISGDNRKSESKEIETMNTIRNLLLDKKETKAEILPIEIIDKKDILPNSEITAAYEKIRKIVRIGSQYEYLARYAEYNPGIELGAICPDGEFSGISEAINVFGGLIKVDDSYVIDKIISTDFLNLVFGKFVFPIIKIKETEMLKYISEWGYEDIMSHIWFCHNPIDGKPCGLCRPCEQKMEGNMEFLLPPTAQKRYKKQKRLQRFLGKKANFIMDKIYR